MPLKDPEARRKYQHQYYKKWYSELKQKDTGVYAYVIAWRKEGPSKIGISGALSYRIKQLQSSNPYKLKVFHKLPTTSNDAVERLAKDRLSEQQLEGEWFNISVDTAWTYLLMALEEVMGTKVAAD